MKKLFLVMIAAGVLLVGSVAEGADWLYFLTDDNGCAWYYEFLSLKDSGKREGERTVLVKNAAESNGLCISETVEVRKKSGLSTEGYGNFSEHVSQYVFDCPAGKKSILVSHDYDNKGRVLHSYDSGSSVVDFHAIIPGSVAGYFYELTCNRRLPDK